MCSLLISENCRTKHWNNHLLKGSTTNHKSKKKQVFSDKLTDFDLIPLKQEQSNLFQGSSIIGKLENDATIPLDTPIHAYRGSTTKKKL